MRALRLDWRHSQSCKEPDSCSRCCRRVAGARRDSQTQAERAYHQDILDRMKRVMKKALPQDNCVSERELQKVAELNQNMQSPTFER